MRKKQIKAAALKYRHRQDNAPLVTAKGVGESARRIIDIAHAYGIPVEEDSDLLEVLSALDLYQEIPPDLYRAVAELLAFVYMITGKIRV